MTIRIKDSADEPGYPETKQRIRTRMREQGIVGLPARPTGDEPNGTETNAEPTPDENEVSVSDPSLESLLDDLTRATAHDRSAPDLDGVAARQRQSSGGSEPGISKASRGFFRKRDP